MNSYSKKHKRQTKQYETGELRIIGGQWKRTKLSFPALDGVRPTPSRVRETLFNWLAPYIQGSVCIDLFAGSGALGMEALSRGAQQAFFVDQASQVCTTLNEHISRLNANAQTIQANALDIAGLIDRVERLPDIIFCDPPFNKGTMPKLIEGLNASRWLDKPTHIYIETEATLSELEAPSRWQLVREKRAGDVIYRLYLSA